MSSDHKKEKFIAIVTLAKELDEDLDWAELSLQLDVLPTQIGKWRKELERQEETNEILTLMEELPSEVLEVPPKKESDVPELMIKEDGSIGVVLPEPTRSVTHRDAFKNGVSGLKLLNEEVQGTAGVIVGRIADMMETNQLSPHDLAKLTSALSGIQQAFFNKPVTNIQVNTVTGEGKSLLSAFRGGLQS